MLTLTLLSFTLLIGMAIGEHLGYTRRRKDDQRAQDISAQRNVP